MTPGAIRNYTYPKGNGVTGKEEFNKCRRKISSSRAIILQSSLITIFSDSSLLWLRKSFTTLKGKKCKLIIFKGSTFGKIEKIHCFGRI